MSRFEGINFDTVPSLEGKICLLYDLFDSLGIFRARAYLSLKNRLCKYWYNLGIVRGENLVM